jgi:DNA-binding transcriptional regulator YhcF (GntR family)
MMNEIFHITNETKEPKYIQIINSVTNAISCGKIKKGQQLPSINEFSDEFLLSRATVEKAYNILRSRGIIVSVKGKGFYIDRSESLHKYKILLLFNKISNYKKQIYNSFVETMGNRAVVDLKIHHFNADILEGFIDNHLHEYDYFVIMPHFYENAEKFLKVVKQIPNEKLILLDKDIPQFTPATAAVYQDFKNDIADTLESGYDLLKKYNKLYLVFPKLVPYPPEIVTGFRSFCMQYKFPYQMIHEIEGTLIKSKEAYIVIEETDLVNLIKKCRSQKLTIGEDVGILSYNETPLKEILLDGITVISTDHNKMGETAARLIIENRKEKIKNPFMLVRRKSL